MDENNDTPIENEAAATGNDTPAPEPEASPTATVADATAQRRWFRRPAVLAAAAAVACLAVGAGAVAAIGHDDHRFEATQRALGAPILG